MGVEDQGTESPKGWRKPIGHRTTLLDARRAAEKWLAAASLRPDLQRLAMQSLPPEERPKTRRRKSTTHSRPGFCAQGGLRGLAQGVGSTFPNPTGCVHCTALWLRLDRTGQLGPRLYRTKQLGQ